MNYLMGLLPHVINPPALVQAAFDEQRALEEIRAAVSRRDEAKGDYKSAILEIGQKLNQVRRAMPGETARGGGEKWSPSFLAFIERCGITRNTAKTYMSYARDPKRLDQQKQRATASARHAKMALKIRTAIRNGATMEELDRALTEIIGD